MKTRKLLAVVLAVAMLASFISVPVFAEGEGAILEDLEILIGPDEDGVTEAYLASTASFNSNKSPGSIGTPETFRP